MSKHKPIIDVDPVVSTRDKAKNATADSTTSAFQAPSFGRKTSKAACAAKAAVPHAVEGAPRVAQATVIGNGKTDAVTKKPGRVAGAVQTVAGGAIMLVGVPMLILPGPGLIAIGGGAAIAASGVKKMLGK